MADDGGLLLNLTCETVVHQKKSKNTKSNRLFLKREERRTTERLLQDLKTGSTSSKHATNIRHSEAEESSPVKAASRSAFVETDQNQRHKRKRENDADHRAGDGEATAKKYKNTLFYNNPEIPRLSKDKVDTVTEKVFSGDKFSGLGLHPYMVTYLEEKLGMTEATAVQKAAIPQMLAGRDILVKSQTGSGKTLAYAVPIIHQLQEIRPKIDRADGMLALVIVPTRELARQSFDIFQKLVNPFTWLVPGCLMGGESKKKEKARLRKGINIVISTPGRFLDHIKTTRNLQLARVGWLIIDEADRLLDMGFEKEVREIVTALSEKSPKERRTALLSATLSAGVEQLAGMSLQSPVKIDLTSDIINQSASPRTMVSQDASGSADTSEGDTGKVDQKFATPENLKHHCVIVPSKLRLACLAAFLLWKCKMAAKKSKILVFMSTQEGVDFHHKIFQNVLMAGSEDEDKELLYRLHGDMPQKDRTDVFTKFSRAESGVLLCTDVAARGLDLPQVKWIVQYTAPGGSTDYIHRVGRTARIGSRGNALLFLTPAEALYTTMLSDCNINLVEVQMNDILKTLLMEKHKLDYLWDDNTPPTTIQEAASLVQAKFTKFIQINQSTRTMARKAYQSFIGAYSAYPSTVKHIFHVKSLHLGHVATSFALQEAPSKIGNIVGTQAKKHGDKGQRVHSNTQPRHQGALPSSMHRSNRSEFSSGMDNVKSAAKHTRKDRAKLNTRKAQRQHKTAKFKSKPRGKMK